MSLNQKGAQSKKPLGEGKKTESSSTNRILYGLLAILVIVFVWKISSKESGTMDIPVKDNNISVPDLYDDTKELNPNIEVEIEEAGIPIAEAEMETKMHIRHPKTDVYESGTSIKRDASPYPKKTRTKNQINKAVKKNKNSGQSQYLNDIKTLASSNGYSYNEFSYIYAGEIEMPQGTYRGLDQDGFARTNIAVGEGILRSDNYAGINLAPIFEDQLGVSKTTYQLPGTKPNKVVSKLGKRIENVAATKRKGKYPSTGIPYGEDAYPLKDTLPWHPYESLAYMREEKEVFVAEKVRAMPTSDDLEPNIHPSTLGDRDTRMGFGVVIRPK